MKLRIDNNLMVDEFFTNTLLLGIVAPIEQYRFCWHLNQILNFDFRINNQIEIQLNKKARKYFFAPAPGLARLRRQAFRLAIIVAGRRHLHPFPLPSRQSERRAPP